MHSFRSSYTQRCKSLPIMIQMLEKLKRLNERKLHIQECKVQKVKASNASSRDKDSSGIVSDTGNDQSLENQSNTSRDKSSRSRDDTDIRPSYDTEPMVEVSYTAEYNVFAIETQHFEQLENMTDTSLMEKIQKQLRNANASLAHELKECKSTLEETNRTLGESNSTWDRCIIALQNKEIELEKYKTYNDRTLEYDKLKRKLKDTLELLAQKEHDIKEGLKLKAYDISIVKEKNDELVKHNLLTKSSYEGLSKEKNKVIKDLKLKEERDIEKLISVEKQLTFLNEIIYKRNQSIQTIDMLALKGSTYNKIPTFANPMYLKKAQSEKPCLYEIPYDTSDLANLFSPDKEETLTLEQEGRSKLNKDKVKPYDYTQQNSLYEIFKLPSWEYLDQLAHANEVRKKMWRKSFVKNKPHIVKNIAWDRYTHDAYHAPTTEDMTSLLKTCLMPFALKTQNDSFKFVNELKQDMFADLHELKKLIEKMKGKSVDPNFEKQSILGKPPLQPIRNQPVVRQPTAYKSERSQVAKHRSASQFDVSNNLKKPITPHSWPQVRKLSFAKPYDVNALALLGIDQSMCHFNHKGNL
ncbi:hypothetical protein Tco_1374874 [Tanacetum coccineum]